MGQRSKAKNAYWIGVPDTAYQQAGVQVHRSTNEIAYFRHSFHLNQLGTLRFTISGNSRYRLWVNGHPVTSGPCKGDRWRHYYETVDATAYLQTGYNCIAVKVVAYPCYESKGSENLAPLSVMANGAGPYLMAEGCCTGRNGRVLANITTGHARWSVSVDRAVTWVPYPISSWMGAMEKVDGSLLPHGWTADSEPEGLWAEAERKWMAAGNPEETCYGLVPPLPLEERPIPLLYEKRRSFQRQMPVTGTDRQAAVFPALEERSGLALPARGRYTLVLDAGELTTGYLQVKLVDGAGSTIRIRYAEGYSAEGNDGIRKIVRDDAGNGQLFGNEDVYIPSGREEVYEPFWFRTFRFIQMEVDTGEQPLLLHAPVYLETGYPLEVKSTVHASIPWVNAVWDISLRTLRRCMHETYEDCPYFEQLQYTMDTRSQILFTYMVSGDTHLAQKALSDFHSSLLPSGLLQARYPSKEPSIIPVFNIYFLFMIEDYYWQTGDIEQIRRYRATMDAVLEWFHGKIGEEGLIENLGYWEFVDWVAEWPRGVPRAAVKGPSTIHNLLYAAGLQCAARLNELTGRKYMALEYDKRAQDILHQVEAQCWCDKTGLYREGPRFQEFSQHAQIWAVLTGLVRGKRTNSIMKKALALKAISVCSYVMKFYLLRALEATELYDRSEVVWQDWQDMLKQHLTTCPEDTIQMRSDCHGWSALPLYEFTRSILGVKPIAPGWEKIQIEPRCLSFPDFSGRVTTPKGPVTVSWKKQGGVFSIRGQVPEGVPFELCLPDGTKQLYLYGGAFEF